MKGGARWQSPWRHGRCFRQGGHQNHAWSVRNKTKQNQKRKKWLPGSDADGSNTHPPVTAGASPVVLTVWLLGPQNSHPCKTVRNQNVGPRPTWRAAVTGVGAGSLCCQEPSDDSEGTGPESSAWGYAGGSRLLLFTTCPAVSPPWDRDVLAHGPLLAADTIACTFSCKSL